MVEEDDIESRRGEPSFSTQYTVSSDHNNSSSSLTSKTLYELIQSNDTYYYLCCITGMLYFTQQDSTKKYHVYSKIWYICVQVAMFIATLYYLVACSVYIGVTKHRSGAYFVLQVFIGFGFVLQNAFLYPSLYYIYQELSIQRHYVSIDFYKEALDYGVNEGKRVFYRFMVFLLISFICYVLYFSARQGIEQNIGGYFSFYVIVFFSSDLVLSGIYGFLVMEQRVNYHIMKYTMNKLQTEALTEFLYQKLRASIDEKDAKSPINFLLTSAIISTLIGIFGLLLLPQTTDSYGETVLLMFIVLANYGRQMFVFMRFLWEVSKVNEQYEEMIHKLASMPWNDAKGYQNMRLYVAMKELPMGTKIFYYRPSRLGLVLQIGSFAFTIGVSVLRVFFV